MINVSGLTNAIGSLDKIINLTKKNLNLVLEIGSALGVGLTTASAINDTVHAVKAVEEKKQELGKDKLTVKETLGCTWKCYWKTGVSAVATLSCIAGAHKENAARYSAMAGAYVIADKSLKEYQEAASKVLEQKDVAKIEEKVAEKKLEDDEPKRVNGEITVEETGLGSQVCYDFMTGRYFKASEAAIKQAFNNIGERMNDGEDYVSLNELFYELCLDSVELGTALGFSRYDGIPKVRTTYHKGVDGEPILYMHYDVSPRLWYGEAR